MSEFYNEFNNNDKKVQQNDIVNSKIIRSNKKSLIF